MYWDSVSVPTCLILTNQPTNQPTNFMERSPWEANSHSANQEISRLLWNPKVHYRVQKNPSLVPILCQRLSLQSFPTKILHTFLVSPKHYKTMHRIPDTSVLFKWDKKTQRTFGKNGIIFIKLTNDRCNVHTSTGVTLLFIHAVRQRVTFHATILENDIFEDVRWRLFHYDFWRRGKRTTFVRYIFGCFDYAR
jgi:hypothetical protein